jgi:hypothetical protein
MSLTIVPLKNNILLDVKVNDIKASIIKRIQELGLDNIKYKLDAEFLTLVCNLVEHLVIKKDGIQKKSLAVDIFRTLFSINLTDEDVVTIERNIDFIHNNKAIKKVSWYKLYKTGLKEWFVKKG